MLSRNSKLSSCSSSEVTSDYGRLPMSSAVPALPATLAEQVPDSAEWSLLDGTAEYTEAQDVIPEVWLVQEAESRSAVPGVQVPATAPAYP